MGRTAKIIFIAPPDFLDRMIFYDTLFSGKPQIKEKGNGCQ
jgi:hypothetical protein